MFHEQIRAYCQECGKEITDVGGVIAGNRILCANGNFKHPSCAVDYFLKRDLNIEDFDYLGPRKLARAVRRNSGAQ